MKLVPIFTMILLLSCGTAVFGQTPAHKDHTDETKSAKAHAKAAAADTDATYGRIKELTAGQKVVIDVDNAPDKEFELASKDVAVKMGKGLKVGDPVKVVEHDVAGKTKTVSITRHAASGVKHGDRDSAGRKQ
jgi:hypothetical protein